MMESTFPEEYAQLADSLPPLDPEAMAQVDDIVAAHVSWKEDLDSRFPSLADRGRPLRSRDDRPGWVSMETYLRAELRTYFPQDHRPLPPGHHGTPAQGRERSRTEPAPSGAAVRLRGHRERRKMHFSARR